jgi:hypothetical protein
LEISGSHVDAKNSRARASDRTDGREGGQKGRKQTFGFTIARLFVVVLVAHGAPPWNPSLLEVEVRSRPNHLTTYAVRLRA